MKIALPVWAGRVSPVLDVAGRLLVVDTDADGRSAQAELALTELETVRRARQIRQFGVDVLVCAGVSELLEAAVVAEGVRMIPRVCGSAEETLEAFMAGRLSEPAFQMPGCCGRRRRFRGGRRGWAGFGTQGDEI